MKKYLVAALAILVTGSVQAQTKKQPDTSVLVPKGVDIFYAVQADGDGYQQVLRQLPAKDPHKTKLKCTACHTGQAFTGHGASYTSVDWRKLLSSRPLEESKAGVRDLVYQSLPNLVASVFEPKAGVMFATPGPETRSMLGLPQDSGLIVRGVCGPLAKNLAGLKEHDIVLTVNDKPVENPVKIDAALAGDQHLAFVVLRDGEKKKLERKSADAAAKKRYLIGVTLSELDPVVRAQMKLSSDVRVFVKEVARDGAAEESGIKPHDIFVRINGDLVSTREDVQKAVQSSAGKPLKVELRRGKELVKVKLKAKLTGHVTAVVVPNARHTIQLVEADEIDTIVRANPETQKKSTQSEDTRPEGAQSSQDGVQERLDNIESKLAELVSLIRKLKSAK